MTSVDLFYFKDEPAIEENHAEWKALNRSGAERACLENA